MRTVESTWSVVLDGTLQAYSSYVNRVYGVRTEDGTTYPAKFVVSNANAPDTFGEFLLIHLDHFY